MLGIVNPKKEKAEGDQSPPPLSAVFPKMPFTRKR